MTREEAGDWIRMHQLGLAPPLRVVMVSGYAAPDATNPQITPSFGKTPFWEPKPGDQVYIGSAFISPDFPGTDPSFEKIQCDAIEAVEIYQRDRHEYLAWARERFMEWLRDRRDPDVWAVVHKQSPEDEDSTVEWYSGKTEESLEPLRAYLENIVDKLVPLERMFVFGKTLTPRLVTGYM